MFTVEEMRIHFESWFGRSLSGHLLRDEDGEYEAVGTAYAFDGWCAPFIAGNSPVKTDPSDQIEEERKAFEQWFSRFDRFPYKGPENFERDGENAYTDGSVNNAFDGWIAAKKFLFK